MYLDMVINVLPDKGGNPIPKDLEHYKDDSRALFLSPACITFKRSEKTARLLSPLRFFLDLRPITRDVS